VKNGTPVNLWLGFFYWLKFMQTLAIFKFSVTLCLLGSISVTVINAREHKHSVTGTVVLPDETPVYGAMVKLYPGGYADTTDVSGQFTLPDVLSGDYILFVSMPYLGLEDVRRKISVPLKEQEPLIIVMRGRTYRFDEIVVLSGRQDINEEVEKLPSFVTVVERSEFENKATTVADVITATPGANISVMGGLGGYSEVSLRGTYSNQVQVYINGMLLNEAIGGAVNLASIPLTHVESIEVWRSGAPAQFGGDAVGGVVNIKTRDTHTMQKTFSLGYGSFNTLNADIVMNIPFGMSRILTSIDYSSSDNDFEYKSDNGTMYNKDDDYRAFRDNDEYRSANLLSKYNHIFNNGVILELSEHLLSSRKNIPGKDNIRYSHASLETTKNLFQAKMTFNPLLHKVVEFTPQLYHIHNHERYRDPHGNVGWGIQDNIYITQSFNFMMPLTLKVREYATFNITPSNIRRDRYFSSYEGHASGLGLHTPEPEFNHMTNTHFGAKLKLWNGGAVQCNYGDVTRVPGFYELFGDRGGTLSNPKLKPERIYRWDAGMRVRFRTEKLPATGSLEYAYFENKYKDLIQWYTNDAGFISPDNVGGSCVKGTEIIWSSKIINHVMCSGNWTFQKSNVTEEKRIYYKNKQLPNRPKNFGNVKIECPFRRFVPFWSLNKKGSYYLDRVNQDHKKYPGRTLHDAGLSVSFMSGKTTLTIRVKNISDVHTFDYQGMPKPGRSYMATIKYIMD
jgi:outer membrane cobalamin receptor